MKNELTYYIPLFIRDLERVFPTLLNKMRGKLKCLMATKAKVLNKN